MRALILDYGEVVCHPPAPDRIAQMAEASGLDPETFAARYQRERGPYDRGDLTPAEYWSKVVPDALDDTLVGRLRQWDVEMWRNINPSMTEWLDQVRAKGFKTALLSNMHPDMASYARRNFEWLRSLDCSILSCEVRLIKPGRAIYERCLERLALRPSEALFVDDREANVQAARDAGIPSLRFESVERLRDDLVRVGFPVLPPAPSNR